jgi:hypothetical protein
MVEPAPAPKPAGASNFDGMAQRMLAVMRQRVGGESAAAAAAYTSGTKLVTGVDDSPTTVVAGAAALMASPGRGTHSGAKRWHRSLQQKGVSQQVAANREEQRARLMSSSWEVAATATTRACDCVGGASFAERVYSGGAIVCTGCGVVVESTVMDTSRVERDREANARGEVAGMKADGWSREETNPVAAWLREGQPRAGVGLAAPVPWGW